jgi:hypothetical protein
MPPVAARKYCGCAFTRSLQNLVREGQVKRTGKKYKGVTKARLLLRESLKEFRKKGSQYHWNQNVR